MDWIANWAAAHQDFIKGCVVGWAATHPRIVVRFCFKAAMRIPGVEDFVKKNGPALHSWIQEGSAELIQDIDDESTKS